jgi:hypothetical protein
MPRRLQCRRAFVAEIEARRKPWTKDERPVSSGGEACSYYPLVAAAAGSNEVMTNTLRMPKIIAMHRATNPALQPA